MSSIARTVFICTRDKNEGAYREEGGRDDTLPVTPITNGLSRRTVRESPPVLQRELEKIKEIDDKTKTTQKTSRVQTPPF